MTTKNRLIGGFGWRTDVPAHIYTQNPDVTEVRWYNNSDVGVVIPVEALRRVLTGAHTRNDEGNRILFTLDPELRTLRPDGGVPAVEIPEMQVLAPPVTPPRQNEGAGRGWSGPESDWHRNTVHAIAHNPFIVECSDVERTWEDSLLSSDGHQRIWRTLRTSKRPDVVFLTGHGSILVVEVEPWATLVDGIAQLCGDYITALQVDVAGTDLCIEGALVVDRQQDMPVELQPILDRFGVRVFVRERD